MVELDVPIRARVQARILRFESGNLGGHKEVGMPSPNVLRAINPKHNPTQETLERLLKPFGLRIGLAQIKVRRKVRAA